MCSSPGAERSTGSTSITPRAWNTTVKSCLYGSGGTSGYKRISDTASRIQPAT